ncbi:MAG: hypothetical protein EON57_06860, partial [Alphaproteobacteria bacterium]
MFGGLVPAEALGTMPMRMLVLACALVGFGLIGSAWLRLCRAAAEGRVDLTTVRFTTFSWMLPLLPAKPLFSNDGWSYAAQGALIIPMAGLGQRFVNEGYAQTKPLIPVSGRPMVAQATHDLPPAERHVFVLRADMAGYENIVEELKTLYPGAIIQTVDQVTEGQACTALIGLQALVQESDPGMTPVTIGACDNGALYDAELFSKLANDPQVDVIVWGVRSYPNATRRPNMFGWIDAKNGVVESISVKAPLDAPATDPIVLGTFTFRREGDYRRAYERLLERDGRVNGEFYIDALIN